MLDNVGYGDKSECYLVIVCYRNLRRSDAQPRQGGWPGWWSRRYVNWSYGSRDQLFRAMPSSRTVRRHPRIHERRPTINVIDEELLATLIHFGFPPGRNVLIGCSKTINQRNKVPIVLVSSEAGRIPSDTRYHVLERRVAIVDLNGVRVGV